MPRPQTLMAGRAASGGDTELRVLPANGTERIARDLFGRRYRQWPDSKWAGFIGPTDVSSLGRRVRCQLRDDSPRGKRRAIEGVRA
jgi:hypothetical protein